MLHGSCRPEQRRRNSNSIPRRIKPFGCRIFAAGRSCWRSTPRTGVPSAVIRWRSITRCSAEFHEYGAQLLGISVDGVWCHRAFSEARHLHFPLLADFEPKGCCLAPVRRLSRRRRLLRARAVRHRCAGHRALELPVPVGVNPGADGIFGALDALTPEQRGAERRRRAEKVGGS